MSKKKVFAGIILLVVAVISNIYILNYRSGYSNETIGISFRIKSNAPQAIRFYFSDTEQFSEELSNYVDYKTINEEQVISFQLDQEYKYLRLDFGEISNVNYELSEFKVSYYGTEIERDIGVLAENSFQQIVEYSYVEERVSFVTDGTDAFCVFSLDWKEMDVIAQHKNNKQCMTKNIVLCIILDVFVIITFCKIRSLSKLPLELFSSKRLILQLSQNDLKTRFAGSYLGIVWAFVNPIITILVYWFVFQVGFKSSPVDDFPFILWFVSGLIPWFFFSESLSGGTGSLIEYSYLVKKVVFKISILPVVKIVAAGFIHVFFVVVLLLLYVFYGYGLDAYSIQIVYYSLCMFVLVLAISYTTSAIVVFFRDLSQVVNVILQIGMWLTPIMWSYTMMPSSLRWILKINPMYYVVEGYRNAMIYKTWFWENLYDTAYFWLLTAALFGVGTMIFNRLKVHFADVL